MIFGDATATEALEAARVEKAAVLVLTIPAVEAADGIVQAARCRSPDPPLMARADGLEGLRRIHKIGVAEAVSPVCEAGVEMARLTLARLRRSVWEIQRVLDDLRKEPYLELYESFTAGASLAALRRGGLLLDLHWLELEADSPLVGKALS